jgi:uncharacterized YigZ family protein
MTAASYKTIAVPARAEIAVKKSRFIARLFPADSPEGAAALLCAVRAEHREASHNVWAYSLREGQRRRYSDDGEPQGTAGLPVLEAVTRAELRDCLCVVTRYFGGILLGAAGLTRAYAQAAGAALAAAEIVVMEPCRSLRLRCGYALYNRVAALLPARGAVLAAEFADEVEITLRLRAEDAEAFCARLREASGGKCEAEAVAEGWGAV